MEVNEWQCVTHHFKRAIVVLVITTLFNCELVIYISCSGPGILNDQTVHCISEIE